MNWLDQLTPIQDAQLPSIAKEFGEYASQLIEDELLGFDTALFLHDGDLRIAHSTHAIEALLHKAGDVAPFLIVRGDLDIDDTFDAKRHIMAFAVIGDFRCSSFITEHVGLAVSGDFTAEWMITSQAGHGIMNVDGTTRARYEYEPAHSGYDLHLHEDVVQLDWITDFVRPEVKEPGGHIGRKFLHCVQAGDNPYTMPMSMAEAFARERMRKSMC